MTDAGQTPRPLGHPALMEHPERIRAL